MAGKVQIPQASIFTSDPLEQIFAKGVSDRDMSGLNYMFLNAFGGRREQDQQTYLQGVQAANQLALKEAQAEQTAKMMEHQLKAATDLAGKGYETGEMPVMSSIFRDPRNQNVVAQLLRDKLAADAMQSRAAAANAGQGGEPRLKIDIMPGGTGQSSVEGKDPVKVARLAEAERARLRAQAEADSRDKKGSSGYGKVN